MFEWAHGIIDQSLALVRAGIVLFAVLTVAMVYVRTKAVVPVVVAALLAGAVIWAVNHIDWFEQKVGEETIAAAAPLSPREVARSSMSVQARPRPRHERTRAGRRARAAALPQLHLRAALPAGHRQDRRLAPLVGTDDAHAVRRAGGLGGAAAPGARCLGAPAGSRQRRRGAGTAVHARLARMARARRGSLAAACGAGAVSYACAPRRGLCHGGPVPAARPQRVHARVPLSELSGRL